jgi:hypothetical protein
MNSPPVKPRRPIPSATPGHDPARPDFAATFGALRLAAGGAARAPIFLAALLGFGFAAGAGEAEEIEVLGSRTAWRFDIVYLWPPETPIPHPAARWVAVGEGVSSPLPPPNWMRPEFDDYGWPRETLPICGMKSGVKRSPATVVCLRGKFGVGDPAGVKELKLRFLGWGRPSVFLNGDPVAVQLGTPDDKPAKTIAPPGGEKQPVHEVALDLPCRALRRGTNVLALEFRQPPGTVVEPSTNIGLFEAVLTAPGGSGVVPNAPPAGGVMVWAHDPAARADTVAYGDPLEPPRVRIRAPRNGFGSGQIVLCGPADFTGVSARASELKSADGSAIPALAVRIRYVKISEPFMPLLDRPDPAPESQRPQRTAKRGEARPAEGLRYLPIWLTVQVPPVATPGTYAGAVEIRGLPKPVAVPVELTVHGWTIGSPKQWKTVVNLLQSPESVAGHYKVPLWSDRHFQLIEKSFVLMAEAGNDILGVNAVGKTVFGDDPLIVFRREGDRPVPELKFLDRYLSLYHRHCGEPIFLCVQVWHYGMSSRGMGRDGGTQASIAETIPVAELRGDSLVAAEYPMYVKPGTEALWKEVMDGVYRCVAKLGWKRECVLLGTSGDNWPNVEIVGFFKRVAPDARWRAITHGSGAPKWGATAEERTQPNGMVVDYLEWARRIAFKRVQPPGVVISGNSRDECKTDPFCYRSLPVCNVFPAGYMGYAWKGLDYWPYAAADGAQRSALNTYVRFGNVVGSTPRTLAMPGPDGAVATVQFENLREGTQDTEAMLVIREALSDPASRAKLGDALARRAQAALDALWSHLEIGLRISPQGGGDLFRLSRDVHAAAAEVAAAAGAKEK